MNKNQTDESLVFEWNQEISDEEARQRGYDVTPVEKTYADSSALQAVELAKQRAEQMAQQRSQWRQARMAADNVDKFW